VVVSGEKNERTLIVKSIVRIKMVSITGASMFPGLSLFIASKKRKIDENTLFKNFILSY